MGNIFSGIIDAVKEYAPLIGGGLEVYNQYGKRQDRDNYGDTLHDAIQRDYDNQKALYDYNLQYNQQAQAASNANRAAAAGARAATERNRQRAAGKANKKLNKMFEEVKGVYKPYMETGQRLLPQMEGTYSKSLGGMNQMLDQYLRGPVRDQMPQEMLLPEMYAGRR